MIICRWNGINKITWFCDYVWVILTSPHGKLLIITLIKEKCHVSIQQNGGRAIRGSHIYVVLSLKRGPRFLKNKNIAWSDNLRRQHWAWWGRVISDGSLKISQFQPAETLLTFTLFCDLVSERSMGSCVSIWHDLGSMGAVACGMASMNIQGVSRLLDEGMRLLTGVF